jgi:uncharacterized membrane protein
MERMLAVLFEDESKATEGSRALSELDSEGTISVYAKTLITKNPDGTISIKSGGDFPILAVGGAGMGAIIGLLGGPIGVAIGAGAGAVMGALGDVYRYGIDEEFVREVSEKLTPGKWSIVSQISEERVTPLDSRMEALGGTVFRTDWQNVEDKRFARDVAALREDIAQLKLEQTRSQADQKAKLQTKIDKLEEKLHGKLHEAENRSEQLEKEAEAKIQALETKAAKAKGEAKATLNARIARIRKDARKSSANFEWLQTVELPAEEEMVSEMEALYQVLPFGDYAKDEKKLRSNVELLEKEYDRREKVIGRIMEYGTGIESEKALRMYPTPILKKWEQSLEGFRTQKLKEPH